MPLTKRQREILNYLTAYTEQNGFAPSFEEIAENFNYNSLATVHEHLTNLERKGYIKRSYNESRAIEIMPSEAAPRAIELPLLGAVAAGVPIEAVDANRSEEHTSELQSHVNLVCRLLLEKKKNNNIQ